MTFVSSSREALLCNSPDACGRNQTGIRRVEILVVSGAGRASEGARARSISCLERDHLRLKHIRSFGGNWRIPDRRQLGR